LSNFGVQNSEENRHQYFFLNCTSLLKTSLHYLAKSKKVSSPINRLGNSQLEWKRSQRVKLDLFFTGEKLLTVAPLEPRKLFSIHGTGNQKALHALRRLHPIPLSDDALV